jgi:hypothetical protein
VRLKRSGSGSIALGERSGDMSAGTRATDYFMILRIAVAVRLQGGSPPRRCESVSLSPLARMRSPVGRRIGLLGGVDRTSSCSHPIDANDLSRRWMLAASSVWTAVTIANCGWSCCAALPSKPRKARMGAAHFLTKTLPKVAAEMALSVLAYNLTRVMNIVGIKPLMAAIVA